MADSLQPIVSEKFEDVGDVLDGLGNLETALRDRDDDRAVFASAYRRMTLGMKHKLESGFFADADWVRDYLVAFGDDYRLALFRWERGDLHELPDAWKLSFETAEAGEALVLQDLVLGVNAHVNHDLPFALETAGLSGDRTEKYDDHTRINRVIRRVVDAIQSRVADRYSRGLGHLDGLLGRVDETVTQFSLTKAREHAWTHGLALSKTSDTEERRRLHGKIDDAAETIARIVLAPTHLPAFVADAVDFIDDDLDWFDDLVEKFPPADTVADGLEE